MAARLWTPRLGFAGGLPEDIDRIFQTFIREDPESYVPPVNIWEDEERLFVELEIPGVPMEQLNITVQEKELTVEGERRKSEAATFYQKERPAGSFVRRLRLPFAVATEGVEAQLKDGILTIRLPKHLSVRPRRIPVTSHVEN